jgi:hypothetical protein
MRKEGERGGKITMEKGRKCEREDNETHQQVRRRPNATCKGELRGGSEGFLPRPWHHCGRATPGRCGETCAAAEPQPRAAFCACCGCGQLTMQGKCSSVAGLLECGCGSARVSTPPATLRTCGRERQEMAFKRQGCVTVRGRKTACPWE